MKRAGWLMGVMLLSMSAQAQELAIDTERPPPVQLDVQLEEPMRERVVINTRRDQIRSLRLELQSNELAEDAFVSSLGQPVRLRRAGLALTFGAVGAVAASGAVGFVSAFGGIAADGLATVATLWAVGGVMLVSGLILLIRGKRMIRAQTTEYRLREHELRDQLRRLRGGRW